MRIGLVGCGGMGGVHANKYAQMPDVSVTVYDIDQAKLDAFCSSRQLKAARSYDELLSLSDAIDVCLPTFAHLDAVSVALDAKKPTLVEKPMAGSVDQASDMVMKAKTAGTLLVPAHVVRFFPEHAAAHRAIAKGAIGLPASVRLRRGGGAPKADWFLDSDLSGGILLDLAVHEFDWLLWTIGPAVSVTSRSVRRGDRKGDFKGDYALTTISFANGCVAHVESTWMDPSGFRATIEASGNKGMLEYDSRENPSLRTHTGQTANENLYAAFDDPYFKQLRAFVSAARGEAEPAVTAQEGFDAVRLACAAIESAENGRTVRLA